MGADFIPRQDIAFNTWSSVFANAIENDPSLYGLSEPDAVHYRALNDSFAEALRVATAPSTCTRSAVSVKIEKRRSLEDEARRLARIIRATSTVTTDMRIALGLSKRDAGGRSPRIGAPLSAPNVQIEKIYGPEVTLRLRELEGSAGRGKPRSVEGAQIITFAGELPPADPDAWQRTFNTTRTTTTILVGVGHPPGTKVWIAARWFNGTQKLGPLSPAISTYSQGGFAERPTLAA